MGIFSTTMRYTGLSGIDTESMVQSLMKAESLKYNKLEQQRTMMQWKQDAYRGVASSLTSFQSKFLNLTNAATNMRSATTFKGFKFTNTTANGQVSTAVKATAGQNAKSGTYKVNVKQLATNNLYTSDVKNSNATGAGIDFEKLEAEGGSFNVKLDNGTAKTISFSKAEMAEINKSTSVFQDKLNQKLESVFGKESVVDSNGKVIPDAFAAKVTAQVNSQGEITFKPKEGHSITLTNAVTRTSTEIGSMVNLTNNPFDGLAIDEDGYTTLKIKVDGKDKDIKVKVPELKADEKDSFDTPENYQKIVNAINTGLSGTGVTVNFELKEIPGKDDEEAKKEGVFKLTANNTDADVTFESGELMTKLGFENTVNLQRTNTISDFGFINNTSSKIDTSKTVEQIFGEEFISGSSIILNDKTITFSGKDSVSEFMKKINESGAGVAISYNSTTERFELTSKNTGSENTIKFGDDATVEIMGRLGFTQKTVGQDAHIEINGQNYFRSTNEFEIEGLKLQLNDVTVKTNENGEIIESNPVTITAEKDTSSTLDLIKNFVSAYNTLLSELQGLYNDTRAKKGTYEYYQPLSDEQKSNMTESQIEKWEKEAKTGLLYRDKTVNDITSTMRSMMYEAVKLDDGSSISLYEIGITTSSYIKDGGKLVIDEEKLTKAIAERGDDIAQLFTKTSSNYPLMTSSNYNNRLKDEGLAQRLNDIINNATSITTGTITKKAGIKGGSSETLNDMYKQIKSMDDRLREMHKNLVRKENNYYMTFSKMEAAISKNNSQMSSLQSMFGM